MSRKDVVKYYKQVESQYIELVRQSKELDDAVKNGFISQQHLEAMQNMTAGIKDNYLRLSYILFLLNQPTNKGSKKKYLKQNSALHELVSAGSEEVVINENTEGLEKLRKYIKDNKLGGAK